MNTMASALNRALLVAPEREAVVCEDRRYSYAELGERCRRLAGALDAMGLQRGDRVAVVGLNSERYLELYLTIPSAGYVLVPLNRRLAEPEMRYQLEDSGTRVLFCDRDLAGLGDAVERTVTMPDDYEALLAGAHAATLHRSLDEDDLAGLLYTGGTTGMAKGVMLSHRNLVANAFHFMACWPFEPETRWMIASPMFHLGGTIGVLSTVWNAGCIAIMPNYTPADCLEFFAREHITGTLLVPTMLAPAADLQLTEPRDVSALRHLSHGSSPIAPETLKRVRSAFPDAELLHIYGATETAPIVTLLPHEERLLDGPEARSCGQPAVGVEVRIVNRAGDAVHSGEVGEVVIRGPNVMHGYWNDVGETNAALRDGWFWSGDLGHLDDHGYLYLVDRAKDMIVTGGENVYCTEVENALYEHPDVLEAAVFGIPDTKWGEAVHAVVVPRGVNGVTPEGLIAHCRARIAGYKVPKRIEMRSDPLPKSGAGKILKRELRERYWAGHEARVSGG